jgi:hypothetical protein
MAATPSFDLVHDHSMGMMDVFFSVFSLFTDNENLFLFFVQVIFRNSFSFSFRISFFFSFRISFSFSFR